MSETVTWLGEQFTVYEPSSTTWNEVPGLYIFAFQEGTALAPGQWRAVYVGRTHSFAKRLPTHENWPEAERLGATHIHARVEKQEGVRAILEERLIQQHQPLLNVQLR